MGLFWSLQPLTGQKLGTSYRYTDITTPDQLLLTVHVGHLSAKELLTDKPVAEATIRRHFLADDVERIPIRQGRIRGILYKPKGIFDILFYLFVFLCFLTCLLPRLFASVGNISVTC